MQQQSSEDELILEAYDFIERQVLRNFTSVTPEVTRKIELLESMFMGFLDHGRDFKLLDVMEETIYSGGDKRTLN